MKFDTRNKKPKLYNLLLQAGVLEWGAIAFSV